MLLEIDLMKELTRFFNFLFDKLQGILDMAVSVLPDSPFTFIAVPSDPDYATWLSVVNWFFPVGVYLSMIESWLTVIIVWYVYQALLRWAKVTE